ncbi:unnamed protein product [Vitrella brassicaformis CCMP3155]|uniref:Uncharacterized protein n=1 Tax=Vitrella brassicaformis (strain CCMP3155) TaxID=1169540 RepID=A0A0G4E926_VITBC|nr:unnamed protein product [Vitrella brassicaformis CCMP3155]|eukprot:CEL92416.1 unnamed protein product [Vitrella brassicaformis CCMP3155]
MVLPPLMLRRCLVAPEGSAGLRDRCLVKPLTNQPGSQTSSSSQRSERFPSFSCPSPLWAAARLLRGRRLSLQAMQRVRRSMLDKLSLHGITSSLIRREPSAVAMSPVVGTQGRPEPR